MELRTVHFGPLASPITLELEHVSAEGNGTLIGTAQMTAGQRIPATGESSHPADEFSYVLRGQVRVEAGGRVTNCGPGTLMLIPAGEGHVTTALTDTEVLWWWDGKPEEFQALKQQYPPNAGTGT